MDDIKLDNKAFKDMILELYNIKDYCSIYNHFNDIIKLEHIKLYNILSECMFYLLKFDELIEFINKLYKKEIESFELIYYYLLATLAINDLFLASSLISKYKLINTKELEVYKELDGANYLNLLSEDEVVQKAMLLVLFVNSNVCLNNDEINIACNYYELIGNLYELGYSQEIVNELTRVGSIIYKINDLK